MSDLLVVPQSPPGPFIPAAVAPPGNTGAATDEAVPGGAALVRRSGYSLLARVVMAGSRGLGLVMLSRALGASAFGEYSLVIASYAIATGFGTLGLDQAHVYVSGAGRQPARLMLRNAVWMSQTLGVVAGGLLLVSVQLLRSRIFDGTPMPALMLTAAALPAILFHNYLNGMVVGRSWFRYYGIVESAKWSLHLVIVALLAVTGRVTVATAVAALYLPIALSGIAHFVALLRGERVRPLAVIAGWPDWRGMRDLTGYGLRACVVNVTHVLHMRLDVYLIKYFSSSSVVGQYALAVSITDVVLYLGRSVGLVLFAQRAACPALAPSVVPGLTRSMMWAVTGMALLVLLCGEPLIALLFGSQYLGCTRAVTYRLPGLLAETGSLVLAGDFLGRARMNSLLVVNSLSVALGLLLNIVLLPIGGITAAAGSFTVASWFRVLGLARQHSHELRTPLGDYFRPRRSDWGWLRRARWDDRKPGGGAS